MKVSKPIEMASCVEVTSIHPRTLEIYHNYTYWLNHISLKENTFLVPLLLKIKENQYAIYTGANLNLDLDPTMDCITTVDIRRNSSQTGFCEMSLSTYRLKCGTSCSEICMSTSSFHKEEFTIFKLKDTS